MTPVVAAIEAGHYIKSVNADMEDMTGECRRCPTSWPCPTIVDARSKVRQVTLAARGTR